MLGDFLSVLPPRVRDSLILNRKDISGLQELRFRAGQPVLAYVKGREYLLGKDGLFSEAGGGKCYICEKEEIEDIVSKASHYSVYACQEELRQGFFTLPGGHRLGITGQAVMEQGKIVTFRSILSICLRISHEKKDCSLPVLPFIFRDGKCPEKSNRDEFRNTLIIAPPGGGKTTLLRDIIRQVSNGTRFHSGMSVGVVDERWELGACYDGRIYNDLGSRTDILCGGNKPEGMRMLLRSMSPQVLAADEIGRDEDAGAVMEAGNSGCHVIASAHGNSLDELLVKSCFRTLHGEKTFGIYIILGNRRNPGQIRQIINGEEEILWKEK